MGGAGYSGGTEIGEKVELEGGAKGESPDYPTPGFAMAEGVSQSGRTGPKGDPLFENHVICPEKLAEARKNVLSAHVNSDESVSPKPLFYG